VSNVDSRVVEIIAEELGVNKNQITLESHFINDLGADSLDQVELVMALEDEFDISIPEEAMEKIQTVGEAIEYIKSIKPELAHEVEGSATQDILEEP